MGGGRQGEGSAAEHLRIEQTAPAAAPLNQLALSNCRTLPGCHRRLPRALYCTIENGTGNVHFTVIQCCRKIMQTTERYLQTS